MKYLPLIWFGIWRKPLRTTLILLQVAVAFALFGVLQGMKTGVEQAVAQSRADILFVGKEFGGAAPLPIAYADRLRSTPGVKAVTFGDGLLGSYQNPTERVFVFGVEKSDIWLTLLPPIATILPKDLHALQNTRTGVLITADIGRKYGWHIGDRIPLTSATLQTNRSGNWVFDIVGIVTDHEPGQAGLMVANYAYLDEARALNKGTVRNFFVQVSDPTQAAAVSDAIDRAFANSSSETKTSSFRELAQQQMQSIGDLNFAIRSIVGAVLVALLFSISTMMMQNIRERIPELAVLKTLGFTDSTVFFTVVLEALGICLTAALVGLGLSAGAFPYAAKFIASLSMPIVVFEYGAIGAVCVALISAAVPAVRAARLQVVDALAGR